MDEMSGQPGLQGREEVVASLQSALDDPEIRLVTVTGLPGVGRTTVVRVALEHHAAGGPAVRTISARTITEAAGLTRALADAVTDSQLVFIDDVDETREPGATLRDVLAAAPDLRLVTTARSPLRLDGEAVIRVEPLPDPDPAASPAELALEPAVRLFVEVAESTGTTAALDGDALRDIARICRHLGGLPLAIELAAARTRSFSPATLADLLDRSTPARLLTRDGQGEQSIVDALALSESLLKPEPRQLLLDLSVFCDAVPMGAIEAVTASANVLDDLSTLVDVHLVEPSHDGPESRFRLHRLVRAHVQAAAREDADRWRGLEHRHSEWAVRTTDEAVRHEDAGRPMSALATITAVEPDLIAALDRAVDQGDDASARRLCLGLLPMWFNRGCGPADLTRLEGTLAAGGSDTGGPAEDGADTVLLRAWRALLRIELARSAEEVAAALPDLQAATDRSRELGGRVHVRVLFLALLAARVMGDRDAIGPLCTEGRSAAEAAGDQASLVRFEAWTGMLAHQAGRIDEAVAWGRRGFERASRLDDPSLVLSPAGLLRSLPPGTPVDVGDPGLAPDVPGAQRLVEIARECRDLRSLAWLLPVSAAIARETGDHASSARLSAEALRRARTVGAWPRCVFSVMFLALVAFARGDATQGARLAGAVAPYREVIVPSIPPWTARAYEQTLADVAPQESEALRPAFAEGGLLTVPAAVDEALAYADRVAAAGHDDASDRIPDPSTHPAASPLTAREEEVLALLSTDATNADIARTLGISPKTVMHHTSSIYRKLEVRGRAQAVAWHLRRSGGAATPR